MSGNVEAYSKSQREAAKAERVPPAKHYATLQTEVCDWVRETFRESGDLAARMRKLWEEVSELYGAYNDADRTVTPEFLAELADVHICLMALAGLAGKELDDLSYAKMMINKGRVFELGPDGQYRRVDR